MALDITVQRHVRSSRQSFGRESICLRGNSHIIPTGRIQQFILIFERQKEAHLGISLAARIFVNFFHRQTGKNEGAMPSLVTSICLSIISYLIVFCSRGSTSSESSWYSYPFWRLSAPHHYPKIRSNSNCADLEEPSSF